MFRARWCLLVAGLATVLFCAQAAWSDPVLTDPGTGTVNLTVEKFVSIRIPDGPGDGVQSKAYGMIVPAAPPDGPYIGTSNSVSTTLQIYALANCGTWVKVPAKLMLQDHGTYEAEALVTIEGPGTGLYISGNSYYKRYASAIGPEKRILNATVSVTKHPWTASDLAGYYWQTLFVDIQASDSVLDPGGWAVHTEPIVPPHF